MLTPLLRFWFSVLLLSIALPARSQTQLPDGAGRDILQTACANCHELARVVRAGYSERDWKTVLQMMKNVGAQLPDEQFQTLALYLAKNFPEKSAPPGAMRSGPVQVSFKEWVLPTPGSRPHDPLASLDGTIWYTGQMANALGHIEPTTGRITEYHPDTPMSGPHGLVADINGNIWFTANFAGYIGKLDPGTGKFTEYKLPSSEARDPHTPLIDQNGILWFTVQSANMVGRLDPATGQIKLVTSPTPRSNPYGMVITSKGVPYFCEFGTNKLASIDPETLSIHEYLCRTPTAARGASPSRPMASSGIRISRAVPSDVSIPPPARPANSPLQADRNRSHMELRLPKAQFGTASSGVRPNTLVRFNSVTAKFQTWAIPSGGGVVRNMMTTHDDNIVIAESGVDRVALVEIK